MWPCVWSTDSILKMRTCSDTSVPAFEYVAARVDDGGTCLS